MKYHTILLDNGEEIKVESEETERNFKKHLYKRNKITKIGDFEYIKTKDGCLVRRTNAPEKNMTVNEKITQMIFIVQNSFLKESTKRAYIAIIEALGPHILENS